MRIGEICTREVVYCERHTGIVEVAQLMRRHHVGDVIVADAVGDTLRPVGIVTDRDLAVEVLAQRADPDALTAHDLMSQDLELVREGEHVYDAIVRMREHGVSRLPVIDECDALIGVLTADDVNEFLAEELTLVAGIVPRQIAHEKTARSAPDITI